MRRPFGLQFSDLESIESVFEQELTSKEAKKVLGGKNSDDWWDMFPYPHSKNAEKVKEDKANGTIISASLKPKIKVNEEL